MLHLDKINKINIIYIIVFIFLSFTLLHLYKINKYDGFNNNLTEDQIINDGVNVSIGSPSQVKFTEGTGTLQNIIDTKLDESEHNIHKNANIAEHTNINNFIGTKVAQIEYDNKINEIENILTTDKNNVELKFENHKTKIKYAMPDSSIIMHTSPTAPDGWQLCDGTVLYEIGNINRVDGSRFPNLLKTGENFCRTPDLRGRFILGAGDTVNNKNNTYPGDGGASTGYTIHNYKNNLTGGALHHQLTNAEMPIHNHGGKTDKGTLNILGISDHHYYWYQGFFQGDNEGPGDGHRYYPHPHTHNIASEGGDALHNNMPPYYVLTYIIKQPRPLS